MRYLIPLLCLGIGAFATRYPRYLTAYLILEIIWLNPAFTNTVLGLPYVNRIGSIPGVSLGFWLSLGAIFGIAVNLSLSKRSSKRKNDFHHYTAPLLLFSCAVLIIVVNLSVEGASGGLALFLDSLLGPFLLLIVLIWSQNSDPQISQLALRLVTISMCIQGLIASLQYFSNSTVLSQSLVSLQPWYQNHIIKHDSLRGFGTMDHPLLLGNTCAFVICFIPLVFHTLRARTIAMTLLMAGVLASGARSALILMALSFLLTMVRHRTNTRQYLFYLGSLVVIITSGLINLILTRSQFDNGSYSLRTIVYGRALQDLRNYLLVGLGPGQSSLFVENFYGLQISLESFPLIWCFEYGVVATILLLTALFSYLQLLGKNSQFQLRIPLIALTLIAGTWSSLAVKSQTVWIFAILLSLLTLQKEDTKLENMRLLKRMPVGRS